MDYTLRGIFSPWLYNRAVDSVAAISQSVAKALVSSGVASDRITLIPSGVDVDLFCPPTHEQREQARQALGINADEIVIVAVGMLEPRKGHRYLLDAIAAISQSASPESKTPAGKARLKLMIAGAGSQFHSLGDHAQQLGISALVNLLGLLPDPRPMLAAADIFVQPSLKEGLGVSILEAMATGLPIAATTAGGIAEVLDEEITGILVPPADAASMATALSRLIASRELRTELGSAARIRAVRDYSMATMAERTIAFYQTSLARHSNQKRGTACAA
jgi:glycosyltransferase involved in cell wall biosynthesis